MDWGAALTEQLTWHWTAQLRPRLDGLTDEEYRWEPVAGAWNVRPAGSGGPANQVGSGAWQIDFAFPEPTPAPVTTIAWRLAHVTVGVFGQRNTRYFGGPPIDYESYDYPGAAGQALADLDAGYQRWVEGLATLGPAELVEPCQEAGHEQESMAALVLHIHREVIHHGAEVALLRDLWVRRG